MKGQKNLLVQVLSLFLNNKRDYAMDKYFFKIRLAGKKIEVECHYKYVFYECRNYLSKFDEPDFVVGASLEEIKDEAINIIGSRIIEHSDKNIAVDYVNIESKIILKKIANVLIGYNTLLIHGAAIAVNGKSIIFMANSGTGKTTHIMNWLRIIPGTIVVNGDKPFVDVDKRIVYGTPWSGKEGLNTNMSVPIGGIVVLERGKKNHISEISFKNLLPNLIQQTYIPNTVSAVEGYGLLSALKDVPCFKLHCNMEKESAIVAYSGLHRIFQ